jgi:hypothetical protein
LYSLRTKFSYLIWNFLKLFNVFTLLLFTYEIKWSQLKIESMLLVP